MKLVAVVTRVFVEDLDRAVEFYKQLTGQPIQNRFSFGPLQLAVVGNFLLIAGPATAEQRKTAATLLVDELEPFRDAVVSAGGEVLVPPQPVPTGRNMVLRHPDGALFEYVALKGA